MQMVILLGKFMLGFSCPDKLFEKHSFPKVQWYDYPLAAHGKWSIVSHSIKFECLFE